MWREGRGDAYGSIASSESIHSTFRMLEFVIRKHGLVDVDDGVPELLVVFFEDEDYAGGLGVEGAGDVFDGVVDELFDAGIGDCGFVG